MKFFWQWLAIGQAIAAGYLAVLTPMTLAEVQGNPLDPMAGKPQNRLASDRAASPDIFAQNQENSFNPSPNIADPLSPPDDLSSEPMGQVNSVYQLSDVQPTDWAFGALQSLVERYGCIAGYPDSTYRGDRALTRYEFAAGLNACMEKITLLINKNTPATREDLAVLQQLASDFSAELATFQTRLDSLSVDLENKQFSTTTRLTGEALFVLGGIAGSEKAGGDNLEDRVIFGERVMLNFDTSFTGKDLLHLVLLARNLTPFRTSVTGTNMTSYGFDGNENNQMIVDHLQYRFPVGERATVMIDGAGGLFNQNVDTLNPFLKSSGRGALSRFARFNPIYRLGGGVGASAVYKLSDNLSFSAGYLAQDGNKPDTKAGLFNGSYGALAQLNYQPTRRIGLALTYVNSYFSGEQVNATGTTGSAIAREPFGKVATSADSYGLEASFQFNPKFNLSTWAGWTIARAEHNGVGVARGDEATIFNWAVTLAFPDLGKPGNLGGIAIGMPPKAIANDISAREDKDTSLHLEFFYRFQINDYIGITPGLMIITNPEHDADNENIYIGTLRTTFSF